MIGLVLGIIVVFFGAVVFIGAPYVPSRAKYVKRAFDHFGIGRGDTLVDIGSGDGVVLRVASTYGAKAIGYEINPFLAGLSRLLSLQSTRITVVLANFWYAKLPKDVTIVYAFSVSRDEKKVTKLLQREADRLQRPLKLLCHGSPFKAREADETYEAYYLYIFQPLQSKKA